MLLDTIPKQYLLGCIICPSGFECSGGMNLPKICADGYVCVSGNTVICPSNYFCNTGNIIACPIDYCSPAGSSDSSACVRDKSIVCPEKFYCPTSLTKFNCNAGSYCPGNRSIPIDCPVNSFCPDNSSLPLKCDPQIPLSPLRSTRSYDCYNAMTGKELSPVTIISDGIQQQPMFTFNGIRGKVDDRMYFVFAHTKTSKNSITFKRNVTNVEILAVGGGGAGGEAMAYGDFRDLGNDIQMKENISAGGGGGLGC